MGSAVYGVAEIGYAWSISWPMIVIYGKKCVDVTAGRARVSEAASNAPWIKLQYQLMKASKEKEKALKIQSDLIKKYRSVVTALSGLQIKMKDDDFVQVQSIFEKDRSLDFMFKVEDWGNNVSLLETEYVSRWSDHVKEYLEDRHSVPAFLAAVTLALDREAGGADHHSRLARTNTST
ncbi:hypothetical protein AB6A40_006432 [Gnathostoma spinigerum]|uniref:Uncharacterized protein n=1 Tax=Gnathostoma spinigerum TaxID=75299 RepID=A0ABD6ERT9_9BILA